MNNIQLARQTFGIKGYLNNPTYQSAMEQLRFETFSAADIHFFQQVYQTSHDLFSRNQVLQAFVLRCLEYELKDFFLAAFKRERYLDMRLTAIRGFAAYATEEEVAPLMKRFTAILAKRPERKPYNYQEYEMLRAICGLPYLVNKYGYECFKQASDQLTQQYDEMSDLCKGFFTLDEQMQIVPLMSKEEVNRRIKLLFYLK